jgi:hypothetical protein
MLLEQIERRQRAMMERKGNSTAPASAGPQRASVAEVGGEGKTVGVRLAPDVYAQLMEVKRRHNTGSLKAAVLLAVSRGLDDLLGPTGQR